eukprot:794023_1
MTSPGNEINLKVKTLDQKHFQVSVSPETLVSDFKARVESSQRIDASRQRIIFKGKVLKDDQKLADYGLKDGDTLHLVQRRMSGVPRNDNPRPQQPSQSQPMHQAPANGVMLSTIHVSDGDTMPDFNQMIANVLQNIGGTMGQQAPPGQNAPHSVSQVSVSPPANQAHPSQPSQPNSGAPGRTYSMSGVALPPGEVASHFMVRQFLDNIRERLNTLARQLPGEDDLSEADRGVNTASFSAPAPPSLEHETVPNVGRLMTQNARVLERVAEAMTRIGAAMICEEELAEATERERLQSEIEIHAPLLRQIGIVMSQIGSRLGGVQMGNSVGQAHFHMQAPPGVAVPGSGPPGMGQVATVAQVQVVPIAIGQHGMQQPAGVIQQPVGGVPASVPILPTQTQTSSPTQPAHGTQPAPGAQPAPGVPSQPQTVMDFSQSLNGPQMQSFLSQLAQATGVPPAQMGHTLLAQMGPTQPAQMGPTQPASMGQAFSVQPTQTAPAQPAQTIGSQPSPVSSVQSPQMGLQLPQMSPQASPSQLPQMGAVQLPQVSPTQLHQVSPMQLSPTGPTQPAQAGPTQPAQMSPTQPIQAANLQAMLGPMMSQLMAQQNQPQQAPIQASISRTPNSFTATFSTQTSQVNQPQVIQPQVIQPQVIQPQVIQPQVSQPQVNQPQVNQPQIIQPQISQPQATQSSQPAAIPGLPSGLMGAMMGMMAGGGGGGGGQPATLQDMMRAMPGAEALEPDGESRSEMGAFELLMDTIMSNMTVPDMMGIMQGNWSFVERLLPQIRECIKNDILEGDTSEAARQEFSDSFAVVIAESLSPEVVLEAVGDKLKPGGNPKIASFHHLRQKIGAVLDVILLETHTTEDIAKLKDLMIDLIGGWIYRLNKCFADGIQSTKKLLNSILLKFLSSENHPQLAAMGPMASGMAINMVMKIYGKYCQKLATTPDLQGLEPWMACLSDEEIGEWRRTIAADERAQEAMPAQRPLSDAYKSGSLHKRQMVPETGMGDAKRRRVDGDGDKKVDLRSSLARQLSEAIRGTDELEPESGIDVDNVVNQITSSSAIIDSYQRQLDDDLRNRITTDSDFNRAQFPNSAAHLLDDSEMNTGDEKSSE